MATLNILENIYMGISIKFRLDLGSDCRRFALEPTFQLCILRKRQFRTSEKMSLLDGWPCEPDSIDHNRDARMSAQSDIRYVEGPLSYSPMF